MSARRPGPLRVLHVLAAYDPKEAQGRCVRTIASMAGGEHHLLTSSVSGDAGDTFAGVVEAGSALWQFGWSDRARLAGAVRSIRPDVVHFHGGPLGAATMATGWSSRVPSVVSIYGWTTVDRGSFGRGVGVAHLRRTPVLATRSIANTVVPRAAIAGSLRRAGVRVAMTPDRRIAESLAHQALPVVTFEGVTPPAAGTLRRPDRARVVFAGRAELTRGPDLLAEAVRRLRAGGRDVTADFFFLGAPDADLAVRAASVEGCRVSVGGVDLAAEMASSTAVVLPFRFDGTTLAPALVASEALAAGVPVVGGDVHCLRAAVTHLHDGLLVAPGDVGALCRALEQLLDHPELVERLGANAVAETARRWRRSGIVDVAEWAYAHARSPSEPVPSEPTHRADLQEAS